MTTPAFLQPGDIIAITSTARKISREEILPAIRIFESWGLTVLESPSLYQIENQYAGTDAERSASMQELFDNPAVRAIICARGGYGTVRIIDQLDFTQFVKSPKWIIGYSDITVLHSHIQQNFGIETLHATMPVNFNQASEASISSVETLYQTLFGKSPTYSYEGSSLDIPGTAKGILTGGNLSILYSLIGSSSDTETDGKILFIEDIDEYLYHIDRMMMALKRSGKLSSLAGLVIGAFTDMKDNEVPFGKTAEQIIRDAVKEFRYPVTFGFPAGHQSLNMPLIMGREVTLEVGKISTVRHSEPLPSTGFNKYKSMIKPALFVMGGFALLYLLYAFLLGRL